MIIITINDKGVSNCVNHWVALCVATGEVHPNAFHGSKCMSSLLAQYDALAFYYFFYHHQGHLSSSLSD